MARAEVIEEERPPHDALPGVRLPRETTTLIGHEAAERALLDAYRSGRMPHAWILAGERGIGRATLAFRLARFVFAHPDAPDAAAAVDLSVPAEMPAARRVAAGSHANLLHLQREWDDRRRRYRSGLSVASVRRINSFLGMTAGESGWRVVIVDPADDMTVSAANALLKNLEEPPRQTLFLLIARSPGALLPTIRSRCRMLALSPLSIAETEAAVRQAEVDGTEFNDGKLAAALAGGSPRRLFELGRGDAVELYRLMRHALEGRDRDAQLTLSARAADAARMDQFLDLFEGYLARRVRGEPEPAGGGTAPAAPLVTWAELWEKAALSGREVDTYNLDRRQFVLDLIESAAAAIPRPGNLPNPQS